MLLLVYLFFAFLLVTLRLSNLNELSSAWLLMRFPPRINGFRGRHVLRSFHKAIVGRFFPTGALMRINRILLYIAEPNMLSVGFNFVMERVINSNLKTSDCINFSHLLLEVLKSYVKSVQAHGHQCHLWYSLSLWGKGKHGSFHG